MQQKSSEPSHYPKDEIDLRELFSLLGASKRFIFIVALLFTIAASVYAFSVKATYQGTAEIRIGNYETSRLDCNVNFVRSFCSESLPYKELIISGPDLINNLKIAFSDRLINMTESEAFIF